MAQHSAKRTGNLKAFTKALLKIRGVDEFMHQELHLEGQKVFRLQKRKADMPLGCKFNSHRLNKVNFSHPCIQTRAPRAFASRAKLHPILEESNLVMDVEVDDPMETLC